MIKNKKITALICLFVLILTVLLTGCIDTVKTIGWIQGQGNKATLQGAAPTDYKNYPLVKVEFLFDDEHHDESNLDEYSKLEPTLTKERGNINYFEKTIFGLDPHQRYYFRAKATYAVLDGNLPSTIVGEEISFSLTD